MDTVCAEHDSNSSLTSCPRGTVEHVVFGIDPPRVSTVKSRHSSTIISRSLPLMCALTNASRRASIRFQSAVSPDCMMAISPGSFSHTPLNGLSLWRSSTTEFGTTGPFAHDAYRFSAERRPKRPISCSALNRGFESTRTVRQFGRLACISLICQSMSADFPAREVPKTRYRSPGSGVRSEMCIGV